LVWVVIGGLQLSKSETESEGGGGGERETIQPFTFGPSSMSILLVKSLPVLPSFHPSFFHF